MYAVRTFTYCFLYNPFPPPLSLWHLELPVARVLHMFVPFLTSDWLIPVLVWFIYKTSFLHSSQAVIFFRLFRLYFLIKLFSFHYILDRIFQVTPGISNRDHPSWNVFEITCQVYKIVLLKPNTYFLKKYYRIWKLFFI